MPVERTNPSSPSAVNRLRQKHYGGRESTIEGGPAPFRTRLRKASARQEGEVGSQALAGKPLKRLTAFYLLAHRAKAPVLIISGQKLTLILAAALVWQGCASHSGSKQQANAAPEQYVRISSTVSNRLDFQIVLREFAPAKRKGPAIWLSGVSHIGEPDYYVQIQRHLDSMTVVLFEGVGENRESAPAAEAAPTAAAVAPSSPQHSSAASGKESIQSQLAASLGLVFQLDSIDYTRTNFLHSDLSVSEIRDLMAEQDKRRGEEGQGRGAESFENLVQMMEGGSFMDFLMRIGLKFIGANAYLQGMGKLALMESLEEVQGDPAQMTGLPESMTQLMHVLIQRRNEHVFTDLKKELKKVQPDGSISIFYGTGHMPDFEKQLREKLGYKPINQVWLTVFSVDLSSAGISRSEARWIRNVVKQGMGQGRQGK